MKDKGDIRKAAAVLRKRAEEKLLAEDAPSPEDLNLAQVRTMLHELRVHQIELEMQNEELRRAQEALEESRARYFDLYDLAPVGYLTLNPKGTITQTNLTAARLFGANRAAIVNQSLSRFILSEDQDAYYRCRRELTTTGTPQVCELRMIRRGATPFWVRVEAVLSPESEASDYAVRVVISDITQRRLAEDALQESRAALLEANEALDTRARQLRLLAGELALAEQRERRHLSKTLHDGLQQHLLAARMRLGGVAEQIGNVDLRQEVAEIEGILDESVKISRSLSAELSPPILHEGGLADGLEWLARWMRDQHRFQVDLAIEARPDLEEDVKDIVFESVRELLLNAVKHAKVSESRVRLTREDGGRLLVAVSDEGAGFDPARLTPPGDEGGGFGLFSVRERIGLIGGVLEIESSHGKGSRFTLKVPAPQARTARPADSARQVPDAAGGKEEAISKPSEAIRVLLADDHKLFRDGMERMLNKQVGIRVVGHAADGREAIDLAGKLQPHVILMDVSMPNVDGIEATREIHRQQPNIRIVGLSMYEDQDCAQAMRDAGACDYKTKGCAMKELLSAIRCCVSGNRDHPMRK